VSMRVGDESGRARAESNDAGLAPTATVRSPRGGEWRRALRAFRRHTVAMIGLCFLVFVFLACFVGVRFAPSPTEQSLLEATHGPSWDHWFGTDELSRDELARVLHGGQVTLKLAPSPRIGEATAFTTCLATMVMTSVVSEDSVSPSALAPAKCTVAKSLSLRRLPVELLAGSSTTHSADSSGAGDDCVGAEHVQPRVASVIRKVKRPPELETAAVMASPAVTGHSLREKLWLTAGNMSHQA